MHCAVNARLSLGIVEFQYTLIARLPPTQTHRAISMRQRIVGCVSAVIAFGLSLSASAQQLSSVTGKVLLTQGHETPSCRIVVVKESGSGAQYAFRIGNPGSTYDSIAAAIMVALASRLTVSVHFDPAQTSGCGGEARIIYVTIMAEE